MGIGEAMLEQTVYDDGGQLVSASFMDYAMPRAHHFPMFKDDVYEVPATPEKVWKACQEMTG